MSIIRRHEALSLTNRELRKRLGHAEEEVEQGNRQLESMKREHNVKKLVRHGLKRHKVWLHYCTSLLRRACWGVCVCCRWALKDCLNSRVNWTPWKRRTSRWRINYWCSMTCPGKRFAYKSEQTRIRTAGKHCHVPSSVRSRGLVGCWWPSTIWQSSVTSLHTDLCKIWPCCWWWTWWR